MRATRIELIGFDSFGVRSMATFIETEDASIFIDPAVSLAPRRFSLPPHDLEWERLREVAERITARASEADIIVITHYHYDHHDRGKHVPIDIYRGKVLIIKDPKNNINISQKIRSSKFLKVVRDLVKEIRVGDGADFRFGRTRIKFSDPVPHGATPTLGYVIQALIEDTSGKVLFTSDVEGPVTNEATEFMLKSGADVIILDGPPTYLEGYRFDTEEVEQAVRNLRKVLTHVRPTVVIDHHLLRDLNFTRFIDDVTSGIPSARVITAAEFMGREPDLLEARRRELYGRV